MTRLLFFLAVIGFTAAAWNCWNDCGKKSGPCSRCPAGRMCCRAGWGGGGCPTFEGCGGYHCCELGDCWTSCGSKGGPCSACLDSGKACCRKGWSADPIECGKGLKGCSGYHCCVKQATEAEICGSNINNNWRMISIKYDVDRSQITKLPPKIAGNQFIDNSGGTGEQETSFSATESWTETKSFTHTAGASVTVGTSFKVGVPLIAEGKVSVSVSASYSFSYGKTYSVSKWQTSQYTCMAPAGKKVRCKVLYNELKVDIPYTAVWERKDLPSKCRRTTQGLFTDVSAFDMHMQIEESRLIVEIVE